MTTRTNVQGTQRYFTTLWALYALTLTALNVMIVLIDKPTPDWAFITMTIIITLTAGALGCVHGITLLVAREHDAREDVV